MRKLFLMLGLSVSFSLAAQQERAAPVVSDSLAIEDTTASRQKVSSFDLIFGDSIAEGLRDAGCLRGDAKQGRKPSEILAHIKAFPEDSLRGKNILLTLGAGNAPDEVDQYVPQQLKYLKEVGAARIVVMGVSSKRTDISGPAMNKRIEAFAKKYGCIYGGAIENASDKRRIHPVGTSAYASLLTQAEMRLLASFPPQTMQIISPR